MNHNERLMKAAKFEYPDFIPIGVGILPAVWKKYGREINKLVSRYPGLFSQDDINYQYSPDDLWSEYRLGDTIDEWGCVRRNIEEGMDGYVVGHPIKTKEDIRNLKIPEIDTGRLPHGLMYLRILDLMGFENAMLEFAEESEEIQILIDKVLEYNCRQIAIRLKNHNEPLFWLGDDLGMQNCLAIGPEKWIKYFKPCFSKMHRLIKNAGKIIYLHSDGMIYEIIPDLAETGVDIFNIQFRANGIDNIVRVCKGKYAVYLDLDRQLFPFASPKDLHEHVRETIEKMYLPQGGLGIYIEIGPDIPLENMNALFEAADKYRFYSS